MGTIATQIAALERQQNETAEKINQLRQQLAQLGCIRGILFNDDNGDGIRGPGDKPTGIREVLLGGPDWKPGKPALATIQSQSDGTYEFDELKPGTYRVSRVFPSGYKLSNNSLGYVEVVVSAGQASKVNLGTTYITPPKPSIDPAVSIRVYGGFVFADCRKYLQSLPKEKRKHVALTWVISRPDGSIQSIPETAIVFFETEGTADYRVELLVDGKSPWQPAIVRSAEPPSNPVAVRTEAELVAAASRGGNHVKVENDLVLTRLDIVVSGNTVIDLGGHAIVYGGAPSGSPIFRARGNNISVIGNGAIVGTLKGHPVGSKKAPGFFHPMACQGIRVKGVLIGHVTTFVNGELDPQDVAVIDNTTQSPTSLEGYLAWFEGGPWWIAGNHVDNSVCEHPIRGQNFSCVAVRNNVLHNVNKLVSKIEIDDFKTSGRFQHGEYVYLYKNHFNATMDFRPLGGKDGLRDGDIANIRLRYVRAIDDTWELGDNQQINIGHRTEYLLLRPAKVKTGNQECAKVYGGDSAYPQYGTKTTVDITIETANLFPGKNKPKVYVDSLSQDAVTLV